MTIMNTTHNNNRISALVDGELGYAEGSRAVDQLLHDDNSHGSLQRYQLIGACMRGEAMQINSASLFDQIHQQLQQEPTVGSPLPPRIQPPGCRNRPARRDRDRRPAV
jgi:negative regulator of sigma E activity